MEGRPAGAGAGGAERAGVEVHDLRIDLPNPRIIDPDAAGRLAAKIVDQDIGAGDQPAQDLLTLRRLQVHREVPFPLGDLDGKDPVYQPAQGLAFERLDLDHVRAEV